MLNFKIFSVCLYSFYHETHTTQSTLIRNAKKRKKSEDKTKTRQAKPNMNKLHLYYWQMRNIYNWIGFRDVLCRRRVFICVSAFICVHNAIENSDLSIYTNQWIFRVWYLANKLFYRYPIWLCEIWLLVIESNGFCSFLSLFILFLCLQFPCKLKWVFVERWKIENTICVHCSMLFLWRRVEV